MWFEYENRRSVAMLDGQVVRLRLHIRRCQNITCDRYRKAYRPEAEGRWGLPEPAVGCDLVELLQEVKAWLPVAVIGVSSDGPRSLRKAVARVWPQAPHQLCHFHYLREAAHPVYEADRHAKKELKKRERGGRPPGWPLRD